MWGATYELDYPYRICRDYMDAYMIQYIARGELHFKLRGHHFVAREGEIVLLGCKEKNDYWSEGPARVKWFHFNGSGVAPLMEHICSSPTTSARRSATRHSTCHTARCLR